MTEHDLQNLIRLKLTELGYTVFRANVGKVKLADGRWFDTGLPQGFSDLFAVKNGHIYFIEVKVKPKKPSAEQLNFIDRMIQQGCRAGVAYSVDEAVMLCNSA
jgi:Holliday junction resolvase